MLDVKTVQLFFRAHLCLCTRELLWEIRCSLEVTYNSCFLPTSFPGTLSNELPASWSIPVLPLWLYLENLPSGLSSFPIIKKWSWELMEGMLSDNRSCSKEVYEHLQEKQLVSWDRGWNSHICIAFIVRVERKRRVKSQEYMSIKWVYVRC